MLDVLDHMPADDDVRRYIGAVGAIESALEAQTSAGVLERALVARIEADAAVVGGRVVGERPEKVPFAAAYLDDVGVMDATLDDQVVD